MTDVAIVTGSGSANALAAIAALRAGAPRVRIIGTDTRSAEETAGSAFCDRFVRVPPASDEVAFVQEILRICREEAVGLILPVIDAEVAALARARRDLPAGADVAIPEASVVELCNDKRAFAEWCASTGVTAPRVVGVDDERPSRVVIKPRSGNGTVGCRVVDGRDPAVDAALRDEEAVVQEFIDGEESTVDVLRLDGKIITAVQRVRVDVRAGQIHRGRTAADPQVRAFVERVIDRLGLDGAANVQVMRRDDRVCVIEVNPRLASGLPLTTAAGVNIPAMLWNASRGREVEPKRDYALVSMCRYPDAVYRSLNDEVDDTQPIPFRELQREREPLRRKTDEAALRVVRSGCFLGGVEGRGFEEELAAELGATGAAAVASGADALGLALEALGVRPGDEVILPAFTAPACAAAVRRVGAVPVGADVDPETGLIDPESAAGVRTRRAAAVIAVHLFGRACPVRPLREATGLPVVEDFAQALGMTFDPDPAVRGELAALSFYPTKNLGADGDAGAVVTFGADGGDAVDRIARLGTTSARARIDEIQAAILRTRLPHLREWTNRRRDRARRYEDALAGRVRTLRRFTDDEAPHLFVVVDGDRDALRDQLLKTGIGTLVHYETLAVSPTGSARLSAAQELCSTTLSLPLHPCLTDGEQERIIQAVRNHR